jgi:hypothetical protein
MEQGVPCSKRFYLKTAAGRPLGIGETMGKEFLSVKDFSWKQQLGDH